MWCAWALPFCDVVGGEVSLHRELSVLFRSWQCRGSTTAVDPTVIWLTPTENNASLKRGAGGLQDIREPRRAAVSTHPALRAWVAPLFGEETLLSCCSASALHPALEFHVCLLLPALTAGDFVSSVGPTFCPELGPPTKLESSQGIPVEEVCTASSCNSSRGERLLTDHHTQRASLKHCKTFSFFF